MTKLSKLLATSGAAFLCLSASTLATNAQAQATPKLPPANFSSDEAAYCTATFGWILQVLAPNGLPKEAAQEAQIAFMIWNYELNLTAPDASDTQMQSSADAAITKLTAGFPPSNSQSDPQKVVDYVSKEATNCGQRLEAAYPTGRHPVVAALQARAKQAAAQNASQPKSATTKPRSAKAPTQATSPRTAQPATAIQPAQPPRAPARPALVMPQDSTLPLTGGTPLPTTGEILPLGPSPLENLLLESE